MSIDNIDLGTIGEPWITYSVRGGSYLKPN